MDITQILLDGTSPIETTRKNAENTIKQLEQNLPQFFGVLMQELSNEQKPPLSRSLAGLVIKNALHSKDEEKNELFAQRWLQIDLNLRNQFKNAAIKTLGSANREARQITAQVVSSIALIEIPKQQWVELIPILTQNVTKSQDNGLRQSTLETLGYICEDLEEGALQTQSNLVLTAIVHGMRIEETNEDVKLSAVSAMLSTLNFISSNMNNENERNFIMKVICENTQHSNENIRIRAFQCLYEIAYSYYTVLPSYIQQIFNLTLNAITKDKESVGIQAMEFWITIAEVENGIIDENNNGGNEKIHNFIREALQYLMPIIIESLTKQDEDPESEETTIAVTAGTLLREIAILVEDKVVELVLPFVQKNINDIDWRKREAATFAFGSILEGPDPKKLSQLINQAFPILIQHMKDSNQLVRDTAAWTIASICEYHPEQAKIQIQPLMHVLAESLSQPPKVAARVCHALHNLADAYENESSNPTSPISLYFQPIIAKLLESTKREDFEEDNLSISTYETINSFINAAPQDKIPLVIELLPLFLQKLEQSFTISNNDKRIQEQAPICGVLNIICTRLENKIAPFADRMMADFLKLFAIPNTPVHEDGIMVVGKIAHCVGKDFERYMNHFVPFLLQALNNFEDYHVCLIAVKMVTDLCQSLGVKILPYCDQIANILLQNLKADNLSRDVKPHILSCFGDIALAIEGNYEKYFNVVMQVLIQAAQTKNDPTDLDFIDWINDLRENLLSAYSGVIQGMSEGKKAQLILPHVEAILQFIVFVWQDKTKTEEVEVGIVGLIGDIAQNIACDNQTIQQYLRHNSIMSILKESVNNEETKQNAQWALDIIQKF